MIPILLTIKGLYSYQDTQTIDFTKLTEGQLFGIFGAVGSGKSSILEAISFALYGETERLNLRDNRGYNMMNLKSNELLIDFIFKNHDDAEYRFMVKAKRNSKKFEDVKSLDRTAYKKENDNWLPLESTSAEAILGLSYTNFRRTIIIPQGKFQEFLQLKDKERTDMLKEIFALEKYEFSFQTIALEKKNNEAIQNLEGQLTHFIAITPENILEQELVVNNLAAVVKKCKAEILVKENNIKQQEELMTIFDELESNQKQLDSLLSNQQTYQQYALKIKDFEYCNLNFKDGMARKLELEKSIKNYNTTKSEIHNLYQNCENALAQLKKSSLIINEEFLKIDDYKQQLNDYGYLLQILEIQSDINELNIRVDKGNIALNEKKETKNLANIKIVELKNTLKTLKNHLPEAEILTNLKTWFVAHDYFISQVESVNGDILACNSVLETATYDIKEQLQNPIFANENIAITPENYAQTIQQLKKNLKNKNQDLRQQSDHYNLQKKLGEFSNLLHNGQSCMLCGATEHPNILKVEDVEKHILEANSKIENNQIAYDELEKIDKSIFSLKQNKHLKIQDLIEHKNKLIKAQENLKAHLQKFIWSNYSITDKDLVEEQFTLATKNHETINATETELESAEKCYEVADADFEKYSTAIEAIKLQLTQKKTELNTLQQQIKVLHYADYEKFTKTQLTEKSNQIAQQITYIQSQYLQINNALTQQTQAKIVLEERRKNTLQNLEVDEEKYKKIEKEISFNLEKSVYQSIEEISAILADTFDVESLKKQVENYNQVLFTANQNTLKLQKLCAGKTFDGLAHKQNLENIFSLKQKLEQVNTEFITQKNALESAVENLKQKIKLTTQLGELQNRASNISTLKNLFSGSGFVSYISQVYLQNLCTTANQRFYKLTRQQLRLEVTDKNDFVVRDYLNNGKTRIAKTLSGGQTFQASLSLALALAQSVQVQNKAKQNFFFLDEGFGSLDKEALQVAFETLTQLRNENRIVGIISHVEDLQQEIEVYLTVVNDSFKGSQIKTSWNL